MHAPICARRADEVGDPADMLAGRRVLVMGINYSPERTGIAPYTTGMAEFLAARRARVKVLTGVPHYPDWRIPQSYLRRLATRECLRGVEVVRLRHSVPHKMTALRRASYEATFFTHSALRGLRERPDLILACTPALGAALAAASVARRVGCPLIVVVQDLMGKAARQSGISGGGRVTSVTARLEGAALRAATTVVVVSDSFRAEVEAYGVSPTRIASLRNWTHITAVPLSTAEARARLGWPTEGFLAIHTGNMGFKQDLGNIIEAARRLRGTPINFVLVGDGSQRRALEKQAGGLGNVRFVDLVEPHRYPMVLAASDVLLVNERPSVGEMSLPSKITSYLAAGRPVVAAVAHGGATQLELRNTNGAARVVAPGEPEVLSNTLAALVGANVELQSMSEAAVIFASRHLTPAATLDHLSDIIQSTDAQWRADKVRRRDSGGCK